MPAHSSSQPQPRKGVQGAHGAPKRSAATGRQLSKAAQRSEYKNASGGTAFVAAVEQEAMSWTGRTLSEADAIPCAPALILGRVVRGTGAKRLEVILFDGQTVSCPIAARIAFHGHAATKTDRASCMTAGDYIVVDGGFAAAKLRPPVAKRIVALYTAANPNLKVPKGFFAEAEEVDQGFDWAEEEEEEAVDVEAL